MQYFTITNPNVHDITEIARKGFENDNIIIVQANGLKIEESEIINGTINKIVFNIF